MSYNINPICAICVMPGSYMSNEKAQTNRKPKLIMTL